MKIVIEFDETMVRNIQAVKEFINQLLMIFGTIKVSIEEKEKG